MLGELDYDEIEPNVEYDPKPMSLIAEQVSTVPYDDVHVARAYVSRL